MLAAASIGSTGSGFALTFDGRGTDIATVQLPPSLFHAASGLTMSVWCRVFGLYGPLRSFMLTMTTPASSNWFQPFIWRDYGSALGQTAFDTTISGLYGGIDAFEQWTHLAVAYDVNGTIRTYVNGTRVASRSGVAPGYNLSAGASRGVYLALGVYATGARAHRPEDSFRGSVDELQLWTRALDDVEVAADHATLGASPLLPPPALRYSFDEGAGDSANNSGGAAGLALRLGKSPDGGRFFEASGTPTTFAYTSPAWAASSLPVAACPRAVWAFDFRPGEPLRLALAGCADGARVASLPAHGALLLDGVPAPLGALLTASSNLTFLAAAAADTAFSLASAAAANATPSSLASAANATVHLRADAPPLVAPLPATCSWPLGTLTWAPQRLRLLEDRAHLLFLLGRSPRGAARTRALVTRLPSRGVLYQLDACCDAAAGRGAAIGAGDAVIDRSGAVVYVAPQDGEGVALCNFSYAVADGRGGTSAAYTLLADVQAEDDAPRVESVARRRTAPRTAVFVPLRAADAEGDLPTLTLATPPAYGRVHLPGGDGGVGAPLAAFSGDAVATMETARQPAADVAGVSSFWPPDERWHPLQAIGEQDSFAYGDSRKAWSPRLRTGDSLGESVSGESPNITLHNVTRQLSFSYNPSLLYEQHGYTEFIELKFATAVFPSAVEIGENRGMCSVVRIQGRHSADEGAPFVDLWRATHTITYDGLLDTAAKRAECEATYREAERYRVFLASICQQPQLVDVLRIELDTRSVDDWNEIDYVQLIGRSALPDGVLPANTSGVWYVPDAGFTGNDSLAIAAYDCPFDLNRRGEPSSFPITVEGDFPPPSPPPSILIPTVRVGVLLPAFGTAAAGYLPVSWTPLLGVYQALREINNKSDGVADELLPNTQLLFSYRDSKCDDTAGLTGALHLTREAFGGEGVSAIIGAGCSGASVSTAQVAGFSRVPVLSPSSTSHTLSDGEAYPYFLRVVPSDAHAAEVLAATLTQLWGYASVALVHSTDAYGSSGAVLFADAAAARGLSVASTLRFARGADDFSQQISALHQSAARVVVLYCYADDGGALLRAAYAAGVGGEGYLWLGADGIASPSLWAEPSLAADGALREAVLRGLFALAPDGKPPTAAYAAYAARRRACEGQPDDDGGAAWGEPNASVAAAACAAAAAAGGVAYDAFGYDALLALAHALHLLVEGRRRSAIDGDELRGALRADVSFGGATGAVAFGGGGGGERRHGVAYELLNFARGGFARVGRWEGCGDGCWAWGAAAGVGFTFSTADNAPPVQRGSCRFGEAPTEGGACACARGFARDADAQCVPCAPFTSSGGGEARCDVCAEGRYLLDGEAASPDHCAACPRGAECPFNTTRRTLRILRGYWRHSRSTAAVYECDAAAAPREVNGTAYLSACLGGVSSECISGQSGPRCAVCLRENEYFEQGFCHVCPDSSVPVAVGSCVLAAAALLAAALYILRQRQAALWPRTRRLVRRGFYWARRAAYSIGSVAKVKLLLAFAQVLSTLDSTYAIGMPASWFEWTGFLRFWGSINWVNWVIPARCLAHSPLDMLLWRALAPLVVALALPALGAFGAAALPKPAAVAAPSDAAPRGAGRALRQGLLDGLPLSLVITFAFTPSVSAAIFTVWHCESFFYDDEVQYSYLEQDVSIRCDGSDEYNQILGTAWALIAVWPIGMVALYAALLLPCHALIAHDKMDAPLVRATSFLHRDYKADYFWWEIGSLVQRTVLTGWLSLVHEDMRALRVISALLVSITFLIALLSIKPYKRSSDYMTAVCCQILLVCIFIGGVLVRIYEDIRKDPAGSEELAYRAIGLRSSDEIVSIMIAVSVTMLVVFTGAMLSEAYLQLRQHRINQRWSVCTLDPPYVNWRPEGIYACFLSHYKMEAASDARYMHDMLRKMLQAPVFLDSSSLSDLRDLITEGVHKSDTLVLLVTRGVFSRPWCLLELLETARRGIPVVMVHMEHHALTTEEARHFIDHFEEEMLQINPGGLEFLHRRIGHDLSELKAAVRRALDVDMVHPIYFGSHAGDNAMVATMKDVVERMALATGRTLSWKLKGGEPVMTKVVEPFSPNLTSGRASSRILRTITSSFSRLTSPDVVNRGSTVFICCARADAVSHARVLRSALEVRLGCSCAIGGGLDTDKWIPQSLLVVLLLTKRLLSDPIALFEAWTALQLRLPLATVAITGGGYDYDHASRVYADLHSVLHRSLSVDAEDLEERLPEEHSLSAMGDILHSTLTAIIALPWTPAGSKNQLTALVEDIVARIPKKKLQVSRGGWLGLPDFISWRRILVGNRVEVGFKGPPRTRKQSQTRSIKNHSTRTDFQNSDASQVSD
ncbi:hypothetical protein AB1Y20_013457 [Prymnesium parvum]|uniref:LamG-like jellyroll fold domain-containing protein n=1 Tax=Prymnesium parvum TaxID=97485 RepID=A0AB34IHC0_PRYPA